MLRGAWIAQELLSTFQDELMGGGATLVPGTGGIFEVYADEERVWSRKTDGGFPDRVLGHADRAARAAAPTVAPPPS